MLTNTVQTLLDAAKKQTLSEVVDIDLPKDEDSVNTIAVVESTENALLALAGINSSDVDQQAGKNEHLRLFKLGYPPRRGKDIELKVEEKLAQEGQTIALGRLSLFKPSSAVKKETYQRVLRLSRARENESRLGAIATGLAPEGEIVVFESKNTGLGNVDVRGRVNLGKGVEAADVDVIHIKDGEYRLAYCTDYEVYTAKISTSSGQPQLSNPQFIHGTPHPDTFASTKGRPKFRSIRFLTPDLLLLLKNQPDRKGAELLILEIPKFSPLGFITLRKSLHRAIKSATALSVALLPHSQPSQPSQPVQHAIAVAGQDNSITILSIDHSSAPPFPSLRFRFHAFLSSVHHFQITSLTFSTFIPPLNPSKSPPQYLKLASTSVGSTVVVHTLPLTPFSPNPKTKSAPRYFLRRPGRSEASQITISVLISAIAIALGALFLQAFTEIRGGTPEYLGAKGWLSERVSGYIARPYMFEETISSSAIPSLQSSISSSVSSLQRSISLEAVTESFMAEPSFTAAATTAVTSTPATTRLRDLLAQQTNPTDLPDSDDDATSANKQAIVVSALEDDDHSFAVNLHGDDSEHVKKGKKWEEMEEHEKERWRRRLVHAGEWAVEEGEAVLKGIFFSNVAGIVGNVVGGILAGD